jgi:clan AA aspartic protease
MGFITVSVRVYNPKDLTKFKDVELLVDSGALHMSISKNVLKELGILPIRKGRYKTFEGREIERDVGEALIELEGEKRHVPVIFAEEGDVNVLGVTTLEIFELRVNPLTKKLEPATYPLI